MFALGSNTIWHCPLRPCRRGSIHELYHLEGAQAGLAEVDVHWRPYFY